MLLWLGGTSGFFFDTLVTCNQRWNNKYGCCEHNKYIIITRTFHHHFELGVVGCQEDEDIFLNGLTALVTAGNSREATRFSKLCRRCLIRFHALCALYISICLFLRALYFLAMFDWLQYLFLSQATRLYSLYWYVVSVVSSSPTLNKCLKELQHLDALRLSNEIKHH